MYNLWINFLVIFVLTSCVSSVNPIQKDMKDIGLPRRDIGIEIDFLSGFDGKDVKVYLNNVIVFNKKISANYEPLELLDSIAIDEELNQFKLKITIDGKVYLIDVDANDGRYFSFYFMNTLEVLQYKFPVFYN